MKKWMISPGILLSVLCISLVYINYKQHNYFATRCESTLTYHDYSADSDFTFSGNIILEFYGDRSGQYFLTGIIHNKGIDFQLSRAIDFSYTHSSGKKYSIDINEIRKLGTDTSPEPLVSKLLKVLGIAGNIALSIERKSDYITLWAPVIPVLTCAIVR